LPFSTRLRALGLASLVAIAAVSAVAAPAAATTTTSTAPAPTAAAPSAAARVVRIALAQRGKRYAFGASGPSAFDCSGLVRYAFDKAGLSGRVSAGRSGYALYHWYAAHGLASRSNPQVGDIVVYGGGAHVGIYIGHGRIVSALNPRQGIRVTGVFALRSPGFTTYLHTHLSSTTAWSKSVHRATAHRATTHHRASRAVYVRANSAVVIRAGASTHTSRLGVASWATRLRVTGSVVRHNVRWYHVTWHGHAAWVSSLAVRSA
jgi:peptidoglycan DL-endopeptidase CwlO